jgi:photosystem II stability/assembly factor-like uncharacterized protein
MKTITLFLLLFAPAFALSQSPYWEHLDSTQNASTLSLAVANSGKIFAGFSPARIAASNDRGQTWTTLWDTTEQNSWVTPVFVDSHDQIFAARSVRTPGEFGFFQGSLLRSTDTGASWIKSDSGMVVSDIHALAADLSNTLLAGTHNGRIYRSADGGRTWQQVRSAAMGEEVECFAVDSSNRILAGTYLGDSSGQVLQSTDHGLNWVPLASFHRCILSLAIGGGDTIYAGTYYGSFTNGGIYYSTDSGNRWEQLGLQNLSITSIILVDTKIIAVAFGRGVFLSTDTGKSWMSINSGLRDTSVAAVVFHPSGFLFAGTESGGIHRSVQPVSAVKAAQGQPPEDVGLYQNFPNPFNPSTTIRYALPHRAHVTLKLFNTLGQQVATLVNGEVEAGYHEVQFSAIGGSASGGNASGLASGVYFYRLNAGDYVATKRLLVLK